MLRIHFEGWFQCRLATDPDPSDEPRGVSGWTFAVAGEPDLDRVIRLQDPVAPRSHGPRVGVSVRAVSIDGNQIPEHPLLGGQVNLLDEPTFEGRNGIASEDTLEPIVPFHLCVTGGGVTIRRQDFDRDEADFRWRQPLPDAAVDPAELAEATGIRDPAGYRRGRRDALQAELDRSADPVARVALRRRIADLSGRRDIREFILRASLVYSFAIRGPADVLDPQHLLGVDLDTAVPWPVDFWVGVWDADALCGYLRGGLDLPTRPR